MTPRGGVARLAADRFAADQLLLKVSESYDRSVFDLDAYDDFIERSAAGRDYQGDAIRTVLRLFCSGRYESSAQLAGESWDESPDLQRRYLNHEALIDRLPFPEMLACSLDLATATGKSFVIYAVARVMLNEGIVDRVLVLTPSLTIEGELLDKFNALTAENELTDLMPVRDGHPIPTIVDAGSTVREGEICVENRHAAYERTGSSLADSFRGNGARTLVISDEAHHVVSGGAADRRRWGEFILNPDYGFRYHLGVSGTCYIGNDYFPDVVHRYAIRDAINDGWVKQVYYLEEDDSTTQDERFQKLRSRHEKNRKMYRPLKPLTIAVTRSIKDAGTLAEELTDFLASRSGTSRNAAEAKVLVVTSSPEHQANVRRLVTVDAPDDPTEWIVSVSMLTEGWDVKNVFQIYPHELRAFNSKLLISQVLGRGLRRPEALPMQPTVYVFNHQRWGPRIDEYVAEVLDLKTTIAQRPAERQGVPHFAVHDLKTSDVPTGVQSQPLEANKKLTRLNLHPQIDTTEETRFISAIDPTRAEILTTRVIEKRYPTDLVVEEVRRRLLDHDQRNKGTLAKEYTKRRVRQMVVSALKGLKLDGKEVTQENRQIILNSFGGLRQRRAVPRAKLEVQPTGLEEHRTEAMQPIRDRVARLTDQVMVFYDEESERLGEEEDAVALEKALSLDNVNAQEVVNSFDFKSPVNVVLTSHAPERRFVQQLMHPRNSGMLESWIKAPDVGFYTIEFAYQPGGTGRSKRGKFNPDFFILLKGSDTVLVVETKANGEDSWENKGKAEAALAHFTAVNGLLKRARRKRRYAFHLIAPEDYGRFFEAVKDDTVAEFRSTLQAAVEAKIAEPNGGDRVGIGA
jgi:type III restriction enzyme